MCFVVERFGVIRGRCMDKVLRARSCGVGGLQVEPGDSFTDLSTSKLSLHDLTERKTRMENVGCGVCSSTRTPSGVCPRSHVASGPLEAANERRASIWPTIKMGEFSADLKKKGPGDAPGRYRTALWA